MYQTLGLTTQHNISIKLEFLKVAHVVPYSGCCVAWSNQRSLRLTARLIEEVDLLYKKCCLQ